LTEQNALEEVEELLFTAENNWQTLSKNKVLLYEPTNDGSWIRNWREAMIEYNDLISGPPF